MAVILILTIVWFIKKNKTDDKVYVREQGRSIELVRTSNEVLAVEQLFCCYTGSYSVGLFCMRVHLHVHWNVCDIVNTTHSRLTSLPYRRLEHIRLEFIPKLPSYNHSSHTFYYKPVISSTNWFRFWMLFRIRTHRNTSQEFTQPWIRVVPEFRHEVYLNLTFTPRHDLHRQNTNPPTQCARTWRQWHRCVKTSLLVAF